MTGRLSGVPGRSPAPSSSISSSSTPGTTSARSRISSSVAPAGRRGVPPALLDGRAEHVAALAARDEVALARADRARDEVLARRIAQAHDLALDRPDRHRRRARRSRRRRRRRRARRGACRRCASGVGADRDGAGLDRRHAPAADLAAGALERLGQRGDEAARVDGGVAGHVEREPDGRGERGLRAARLARAQALDLEAERAAVLEQALELLGLVAVARDDERARAAQPGSRPEAASSSAQKAGKPLAARSPSASSASSPNSRLGDRREHAGGVAPGAVLARVEHERAQAALGGAPGDGQADDAAADDGDVVVLGLRRRCHFPPYAGTSRIRFTGRRPRAALSARWRAPVRTFIVAMPH